MDMYGSRHTVVCGAHKNTSVHNKCNINKVVILGDFDLYDLYDLYYMMLQVQ